MSEKTYGNEVAISIFCTATDATDTRNGADLMPLAETANVKVWPAAGAKAATPKAPPAAAAGASAAPPPAALASDDAVAVVADLLACVDLPEEAMEALRQQQSTLSAAIGPRLNAVRNQAYAQGLHAKA